MQNGGFKRMSKRSSRVRLTTMAALSSGVMLSACGSDAAPDANTIAVAEEGKNEVQVFENVFACAKATGNTTEECEEMRTEASERAAKDAPRFAALQDCETEYGEGQCVQADGQEAGSERRHFSPFIVAWFSSKRHGNAPLYKSAGGGFQTANGSRLGYGGAPGKYIASNRAVERAKSVPKTKPASKMAKAGGFGSRNSSWALADRNGGDSDKSRAGRSKGG